MPVAEIVALGMAQVYEFVTRRPAEAKAFFQACDVNPVAKWDEERRDAAAEAMAVVTQKVIATVRRIEGAMDEQANG